ncbi:MAG TPA: hypothetical protein VHE12_13550 [bacterium]|nr:hypothetical protein [bacterium]
MRSFFILAICIVFGGMLITTLACPYVGPHYPVTYGLTPTPTAPPSVAITISGTGTYSTAPSAVTVSSSGVVTVTDQSTYGSNFQFFIGNATACAPLTLTVPAGGTAVFSGTPFSTPGIYYYHDMNLSSCGVTSCASTCTAPSGTIVAQ